MEDSRDSRRHLPVFLDLRDRLAVIVGTGPSAEKRARQLQRTGADIVVVTAHPTSLLLEAQNEGVLNVEMRPYVRGDLDGAILVMCVEDDPEVQQAIYAEAVTRSSLCNVAGVPRLCNFILPSVVRRDGLEIAISTGGAAPEVAKELRSRISSDVGEEWGAWVRLIEDARALAAEQDDATARELLSLATDSALIERLAAGETISAESLLAVAKSAVSKDVS